ncbi:unnamed protein product [Medioppia subpectinata]|uniref:Ku domain-containing protein n=1 Tax=Medioppia subpectinata TaxID=1979941 RepID=A0A7R9KM69_9ACAR|nr:unnamed protein product [Medioppia subpectinata]CAG2104843.1 unnamed protein product [Medioppia subpectinata]
MAPKKEDAIVLAVDCAKTMCAKSLHMGSDETVYELSRLCLQNIIPQKIFAETKNEYLVMEFGVDRDRAPNGIDVIHQHDGDLCLPSFNLLRQLKADSDRELTSDPSNVIEVIDEAITRLVQEMEVKADEDFDNFGEHIIQKLREFDIELTLICDFTPNSDLDRLTTCQMKAIEFMEVIEKESVGHYYDLQFAVKTFGEFELKEIKSSQTYTTLELGKGHNAITIPIASMIKIYPYKKPTAEEIYIRPNDTGITAGGNGSQVDVKPSVVGTTGTVIPFTEVKVEKDVTFVAKDDELMKPVDKEDLRWAYAFGQNQVIISDDDKHMFQYNNNEKGFKGFKILGFTSMENMDIAQRIGKQTNYLYPHPKPKQNGHRLVFQALAAALRDKKEVAIVRYNYRDNTNPQIGYLEPVTEEDNIFLAYHQLPFNEDIRRYRFPSLQSKPNTSPTESQLQAMDSLIDSMDLMDADVDDEGNSCEALLSHEISDPSLQHWFQHLYHRQCYGMDSSFPQEMADYLKRTIDSPLVVREKSKDALESLAQLFSLASTKSMKRKMALKSSQTTLSIEQLEPKRAKIEDMNEIEKILYDINAMIRKKIPFNELSQKFDDSLREIFADCKKLEVYGEEIIDLIELYRNESVDKKESIAFNAFMLNKMTEFSGQDIWYLLLAKEITLITKTESPDSQCSQEMADNYISISSDKS